jgi:hypothetical protein
MGDVIEDSGGVIRKILPASVKHITDNSMLVEFSEPTKGLVRLIGLFEAQPNSLGAGAIDPGQYYVAPVFAFFDDFAGSAGSLQGRIPSGDTRAWTEFSGGLNLDGSGNLVADSSLLATAPTLQVPLSMNYTGALALEVVFASVMQTLQNVTSITFDVAGDDATLSILVLADQYNPGDILIQAAGMDYTMAMPAVNVPLTLRVEVAAGVSTLFVNGSSVGTDTWGAPLGANIMLNIIAGGDDISAGDSMLISSIEVEELAGTLL